MGGFKRKKRGAGLPDLNLRSAAGLTAGRSTADLLSSVLGQEISREMGHPIAGD
jgi:hypothetical protein